MSRGTTDTIGQRFSTKDCRLAFTTVVAGNTAAMLLSSTAP